MFGNLVPALVFALPVLLLAACDHASPEKAARTILVTGFGPFGNVESNPAWDSIRDLDGTTIGRSRIRIARLDVVYAKAGPQLTAAIAATKPDIVLSLGVAPDPVIRLETAARNLDKADAPDNEGVVRKEVRVREDGPWAFATRLPVTRLKAVLEARGFEVKTSSDAGGYLCNHVFYELMRSVPPGQVAGFVHVPPMAGPWNLDRLKRAVRTILETLDQGD